MHRIAWLFGARFQRAIAKFDEIKSANKSCSSPGVSSGAFVKY